MKIERIRHWTSDAQNGLSQVLNGDDGILRYQVDNGIAKLWLVDGHTWMITRTEARPGKPELVINCLQGQNLKELIPVIITAAKQQGIGSIRFHTRRKGLAALISRSLALPVVEQEIVYEVRL